MDKAASPECRELIWQFYGFESVCLGENGMCKEKNVQNMEGWNVMVRPPSVADANRTYDFGPLLDDVVSGDVAACSECGEARVRRRLVMNEFTKYVVLWLVNYTTQQSLEVYVCRNFDPDRTVIHRRRHRLVAAVYHHGDTCNSGHYYADVRDRQDGGWSRYNDKKVSRLWFFPRFLEHATLLFFRITE